jgi:hypothetical protein
MLRSLFKANLKANTIWIKVENRNPEGKVQFLQRRQFKPQSTQREAEDFDFALSIPDRELKILILDSQSEMLNSLFKHRTSNFKRR